MVELKHLSVDGALAFLLIHHPKHAEHLGYHLPLKSQHPDRADEDVVQDVPASLTVRTTSTNPLAQTITVVARDINLAFTHEGKFSYPPDIPYPLRDTTDRQGTLYLRGKVPDLGSNGFNAQQYPPYPVEVYGDGVLPPLLEGRVVIDFWDDLRITAVFKTDDENYVSGGDGLWSPILRK